MDERTFTSLYERTAPALRSYLRFLGADPALADDLLQESFVRFLRAKAPELNEHEMKSYLYKTALSALNDHHRGRARERRRDAQAPVNPSPVNRRLSPDMEKIFGALDSRQQSLLWLAYVEGFDHSEIADLLGIGEKSVRVVLFRARKRLAEMLTREGLGPKKES